MEPPFPWKRPVWNRMHPTFTHGPPSPPAAGTPSSRAPHETGAPGGSAGEKTTQKGVEKNSVSNPVCQNVPPCVQGSVTGHGSGSGPATTSLWAPKVVTESRHVDGIPSPPPTFWFASLRVVLAVAKLYQGDDWEKLRPSSAASLPLLGCGSLGLFLITRRHWWDGNDF